VRNGVERRPPAGHEAADCESRTAAQRLHERDALVEQTVRTCTLEAQQLAQRGARGICGEFVFAAAELHEVFARQVDAPGRVIFLHVLPVLDELQRRADCVGLAGALGGRHAKDVEHELTDGIRGEIAVVEQLLVVFAAVLDLVEPVGVDQPVERADRKRAFADRGR